MAVVEGLLEASIRDQILKLANSQPLIRLGIGTEPEGDPLRIYDGLTLIQMGQTLLDLPTGRPAETLTEKSSVAAMRLLVYGNAFALSKRNGVLAFDEAWRFFSSDAGSEMDRLGRLAASQGIQLMMLTQNATDFINAGMQNFLSRVIVFHVKEEEAVAACELLGIEPTPERVAMFANDKSGDHRSLRAHTQRTPGQPPQVLRPSRCMIRDLKGEVGLVRVEVPDELGLEFSTNSQDRAFRAKQ
jgi:hypothetical protein